MHINNFESSINIMLKCGTHLATKVKDFIFSMPKNVIEKVNNAVESKQGTNVRLIEHYEGDLHWEIEYIKENGLTVRKYYKNGNYDSLLLTENKELKRAYHLLEDSDSDVYVGQYYESRNTYEKYFDVEMQYDFDNYNFFETIVVQKHDGSEYSEKGKCYPMGRDFLNEMPHYLN